MSDTLSIITNTSNRSSGNHYSNSINKRKINNRSNQCNVTRCKLCHPNQPKLTKQEIEAVKHRKSQRNKPRLNTVTNIALHAKNSLVEQTTT